jgi:hypothetical protein
MNKELYKLVIMDDGQNYVFRILLDPTFDPSPTDFEVAMNNLLAEMSNDESKPIYPKTLAYSVNKQYLSRLKTILEICS